MTESESKSRHIIHTNHFQIYNSRVKKKQIIDFEKDRPLHIYTCGPTVYNRVHLGNLKTFVWSDFVVSLFRHMGYNTNHIMNVTDIDDKIIARLPEQTFESLLKFTEKHTESFIRDMHKLGVKNYTKNNIHTVTENLGHIEHMISTLLEQKDAYYTDDGSIYFDAGQKNVYPFLGTRPNDEGYSSARNIIRPDGLKSKYDFVLWKVKQEELLSFETNLGKGRPGWHIECSAICSKVLGHVDIHMGGMDLKFPHHSCEILQSESYDPKVIFGKIWMHSEFLNFDGDKMSKSVGNILYLDDLLYDFLNDQGPEAEIKDKNNRLTKYKYNPRLVRMYLLSKNYRKAFDFSEREIIQNFQKNFINLHLLLNKLRNKFYVSCVYEKKPQKMHVSLYQDVMETLKNDINTKGALDILFQNVDYFLKKKLDGETATDLLSDLEKVNDLFEVIDEDVLEIDLDTMFLLNSREKLRAEKLYRQSDEIRQQISVNYFFEDDASGFSLIKKNWKII